MPTTRLHQVLAGPSLVISYLTMKQLFSLEVDSVRFDLYSMNGQQIRDAILLILDISSNALAIRVL
jgi:hypothetical protein